MRIVECCDECSNLRSKKRQPFCVFSKKEFIIDEHGEWEIPDWCPLPEE